MNLPPDIPPDVLPFLREAGYLEPDPIRIGDPAPAPELFTLEGVPVRLSELRRGRPLVLIFGSYT